MDPKDKQSYILVGLLTFAAFMDLFHPIKIKSDERNDYGTYMEMKTGQKWIKDKHG